VNTPELKHPARCLGRTVLSPDTRSPPPFLPQIRPGAIVLADGEVAILVHYELEAGA